MTAGRPALVLIAIALLAAGCGKKDVTVPAPEAADERADPPAEPPSGWRTYENARAGFTIALPRDWRAREAGGTTRIRSDGGALVASLHADRSETGRTSAPEDYALATLQSLPDYRDLEGRTAEAPRSPYRVGRAAGSGTRERSGRRQRVSVTALARPGLVTFSAVAFSDPRARAERRTLDKSLGTFRARPPSG